VILQEREKKWKKRRRIKEKRLVMRIPDIVPDIVSSLHDLDEFC